MLDRKAYIDTIGYQTRRLVVENGTAVEYLVAYTNDKGYVGNIYLGRVVNLLKGMHAAFVDIGMEKNAFLSMDDLPSVAKDFVKAPASEQRRLKPGQEVIVQVVKEPGGDKGPRLTMNPTIPGEFVVLLPTIPTVGVSRHIQNECERERLQTVGIEVTAGGMGIIMRTASEHIPPETIKEEFSLLAEKWHSIVAASRTRIPPFLLLDDNDIVNQTIRDLQVQPVIAPFDPAVEEKLDKALRRKVWLDSGAYLVIDVCEAMTVIDVNSGKYTGSKGLAETIQKVNAQAAIEAARQIRLRDMGGIVIIDFVNMQTDAERQSLLDIFQTAMQQDRAKYHIHGFTGTGLLELTRRPLHKPIHDVMMAGCPVCRHEGYTPDAAYRAHALLRDIKRRRAAGDESEIALSVDKDIATILEKAGLPEKTNIRVHDKGGAS